MDKVNKYIEINFTGKNISAYNVRAKEIANLITYFDEILTSIIQKDSPDENYDDLIIGLSQMSEGSINLKFSSAYYQLLMSGFSILISSIKESNYKRIPIKSIDKLKNVSDFAKSKNSNVEFKIDSEIKAILTPETKIDIPSDRRIAGYTNIYGTIERIGGVKPNVRIRTNKGIVSCKIAKDLAKELGKLLYSRIGLYGKAIWDIEDNSIQDFNIIKIIGLKENNILTGTYKIKANYGQYFDEISDVGKHISSLRNNNE